MDIASMLEVQVNEVKEVDSKENVTPGDLVPSTTNVTPPVSAEMSTVFKLMFSNDIASVRFHKLHCTACDAHIGSAPSQSNNMFEHPVLHTLICGECRNFYGDGTFEQGDDATDMFCRWCANGGNLYCCSYCSNTFCYNCIRRNFDAVVVKKIEADEKWKCFVCNPIELSAARAICWALLQHVQTVTRILQNNRKMSPDEIEEKMSLDESQCCTRKRKRKWRKNCSPVVTFNNTRVKKPVVARRRSLNSGTFVRLLPPGSLSDSMQKGVMRQHNLSLSALSCEQNNAESRIHVMNNVTVSTLPMNSEHSVSLQCDRPPSYISPSLITAVPTASLLQNPPPQSSYSSSTPMIAIPNQSASQMLSHQVTLPKSKRSAAMMVTPNIIDLDSDSDEPTVVEIPPVSHVIIDDEVDIVNVVPAPAVPVALVSNGHIHKGAYNCIEDASAAKEVNNALNTSSNQSSCGVSDIINTVTKDSLPFREMSSRIEEQPKPFSEILLPHTNEVESILKKLKQKFAKRFDGPKDNHSDARASKVARNLVMHFYRDICITVKELASINDRVIREYNSWKRIHDEEEHVRPIVNRRKRKRHNSTDISLDMGCINESDTEESDSSNNSEDSIINPSELIGGTNALEDVLLFKKLNTVERGTGDQSILSSDKSVQVHTGDEIPLLPADFEQGIGYSVVRKNNRKRGRKCSIQRTDPPSERTGDFEEQFIYYLQHIEDQEIEDNNPKVLSEPTELTEVLEANSPKETNNDSTDTPGNTDVNTPKAPSEPRKTPAPCTQDNDVPDEIIVIEEVVTVSVCCDDSTIAVKKPADNFDSSKSEALSAPIPDENRSANNKTSLPATAQMKLQDRNNSNSHLTDADVEEDCTIIDY